MSAYVIADVETTDPAGMGEYRKAVGPTVAQYGGKFLVRGGRGEVIEGEWQPHTVVVLEFESAERARQWYDSEEYREPKALRQRCANTSIILVEGT